MLTVKKLAKMIDHSALRPEFTIEDVQKACWIAKEYGTASVCVRPSDVSIAKKELDGSDVLICTVIGFPHGTNKTETKVFEATQAILDGAVELDMVINISRLLSNDLDYVEKDIKAVVDIAHENNAIVKVILENAYLTDEQKEIVCRICEKAGADFVKTSTGFASTGATIEDLKLMRRVCSPKIKIKAAGGIRDLDSALAAIDTGAVRLGISATKSILDEAEKRANK